MLENILRSSTPDVLSRLLQLGNKGGQLFDDRELADLLVQYLDSPAEFDLSSDAQDVPRDPFSLVQRPSIGQILLNPNPSLSPLYSVKDFADAQREHPDRPLPDEISIILYLGSAAAALRLSYNRKSWMVGV